MADTVPLTYEAIAEQLGITLLSARRMVYRHRWRRIRDNVGRALVHVPEEFLAQRQSREPATVTDAATAVAASTVVDTVATAVTDTAADAVARLAELQAELIDMAHRLATAEGRAGAAEAQIEGLRAVLEVERRQAGELRRERDHALERISRHIADLARAEHDRDRAAEALAAHLALPWWRRLFG